MLVLRGQDVETQISKIYNKEKMKFKSDVVPGLEDLSYKPTPHVIFVSNQEEKQAFQNFIFETKYVNMLLDVKGSFGHLNNSVEFSKNQKVLKSPKDLLD